MRSHFSDIFVLGENEPYPIGHIALMIILVLSASIGTAATIIWIRYLMIQKRAGSAKSELTAGFPPVNLNFLTHFFPRGLSNFSVNIFPRRSSPPSMNKLRLSEDFRFRA